MSVLHYKLLMYGASAPTVAHLGEDIGADLYSARDAELAPHTTTLVGTGISVEYRPASGARIGTRSSMAMLGIIVVGGEIDAGYRGEVVVMLHNLGEAMFPIFRGDKIAQLVAIPEVIKEAPVREEELTPSLRKERGFGSSGK